MRHSNLYTFALSLHKAQVSLFATLIRTVVFRHIDSELGRLALNLT